MPESPDFDRIAREHIPGAPSDPMWTVTVDAMAEQLRVIWNARGAADVAMLDYQLHEVQGRAGHGLQEALRKLDR